MNNQLIQIRNNTKNRIRSRLHSSCKKINNICKTRHYYLCQEGYIFISINWFVCLSDYAKKYSLISTKFGGNVAFGSRKNQLKGYVKEPNKFHIYKTEKNHS